MSDKAEYIILGIMALFVLGIFLMVLSIRKKADETLKQTEASRKESMQFNQSSYEAVNRALSDMQLRQDQQLENIRETVERRIYALQYDNNQQLERMRLTVDEKLQKTLDERITRSFDSVRRSLDQVYLGLGEMQNLAQGVGDLKKVLTNVKTRGVLGEIQLGAILEQILAPGQYEVNAQVRPHTQERVEYAVKMPGSGSDTVYLPIDAKFPGDIYAQLMAAYDAADPQAAEAARKQLVQFLKMSAKEINTKYIEVPYTTDFAVMFLPFEGLYAEAVNLGVMEQVQRDYKIMIAGPSTMAALLNSLQMGFRTLTIQKHSSEVWRILGAVKTEFDKFEDVLTATQNRLNQANSELDKLVGVRTRSIKKTLGQIQDYGHSEGLIDPEDEDRM